MGGVTAGTAITRLTKPASTPALVTVTVNNECNLSCPHCYLQYAGFASYLTEKHQDIILSEPFSDLAIVGMEPLLNPAITQRTLAFAERAAERGKRVSLITNGLGLTFLPSAASPVFDFIDISFDGGPKTYGHFRGASYERLRRGLNHARRHGERLNALHVLCRENLVHITDMMRVKEACEFASIMFSPYMPTENQGRNIANPISLSDMLQALAGNDAFMSETRAFFLIDAFHLEYEGIEADELNEMASLFGVLNKLHVVPHTPTQLGILRVTYDGYVLSPRVAMHTSKYQANGLRIGEITLAAAYDRFLAEEKLVSQRQRETSRLAVA